MGMLDKLDGAERQLAVHASGAELGLGVLFERVLRRVLALGTFVLCIGRHASELPEASARNVHVASAVLRRAKSSVALLRPSKLSVLAFVAVGHVSNKCDFETISNVLS